MLALDWKKAFASINPEILEQALKRFGVPNSMLQAVRDIYDNRSFRVAVGGDRSAERQQSAGISQGCPLSPFLFVMTMTVLMADAVRELSPEAQRACKDDGLLSILYADDTLLVGYQQKHLQSFLDAVARVGGRYGLELHWRKFQLLQINADMKINSPGGDQIEGKESMSYLGATIAGDASIGSELNRRLGRAWAEYNKLSQLWKHTSLPITRKLDIFQAAVVSTLLYGISASWLNVRQQRQLDGFQARCLRDVLRIPHPFYSRVSNKDVLEKSGQKVLSTQLRRQQLVMLGRVARSPDEDIRRRLTFCSGSLQPATDKYVRRVGRPRHEWAPKLLEIAGRTWGSQRRVQHLIENEVLWKVEVARHF